MAHLYGRYLTNTKEVEVTDRLIEALLLTMKLAEMAGRVAFPALSL